MRVLGRAQSSRRFQRLWYRVMHSSRSPLCSQSRSASEASATEISASTFCSGENRASTCRAASVFALRSHKRVTTRQHFRRGNRQRYDHMQRKNSTLKLKRRLFGHTVDLVKTGESKRRALRERANVTHRGSLANRTLQSQYVLRVFRFKGGSKVHTDGVNLFQMELEVGQVAEAEVKKIGIWWLERYTKQFGKEMDASPRLKKRLTSK